MFSRRAFLKTTGLGLVSLAFGGSAGPSFLSRTAMAAPGISRGASRRRPVLVALFQRGAMDGLAAVPPLTHGDLASLRPNLSLGAGDGLLDLGVGFGLHPAFAPLLPLWREARLAVVHAVGSPDPSRSHFDAQDYMETGTPGRRGTRTGWLDRAMGRLGHEASPLRAVALTPSLPRSLHGPSGALAVERLESLRPATAAGGGALAALYGSAAGGALGDGADDALAAARALERLDQERSGRSLDRSTRPGARYPRSPLGAALRQIAQLIRADVGLEVAFAESGGWDTHAGQGGAAGSFARRARDLAGGLAAFWDDLGERRGDVVVLTMTEFGRTVAENGSRGTDHGHGSCLFVLGDRVDGGKVHGDFPGLAPGDLYQGRDLPVTTDFRSVFAEVAGQHLGIADPAGLFPDWRGPTLPLFAD